MTGQMFTVNLAVDESAIERRIQDDLYRELADKVFRHAVGESSWSRDTKARTITENAITAYLENHPELITKIVDTTSEILAEKIMRSKVRRAKIEEKVEERL